MVMLRAFPTFDYSAVRGVSLNVDESNFTPLPKSHRTQAPQPLTPTMPMATCCLTVLARLTTPAMTWLNASARVEIPSASPMVQTAPAGSVRMLKMAKQLPPRTLAILNASKVQTATLNGGAPLVMWSSPTGPALQTS